MDFFFLPVPHIINLYLKYNLQTAARCAGRVRDSCISRTRTQSPARRPVPQRCRRPGSRRCDSVAAAPPLSSRTWAHSGRVPGRPVPPYTVPHDVLSCKNGRKKYLKYDASCEQHLLLFMKNFALIDN